MAITARYRKANDNKDPSSEVALNYSAVHATVAAMKLAGTVSDASQLQQQAAYAFRVMGQQLRQAGSLRLNLAAQKLPAATIDAADPVAFETKSTDFDPTVNTLAGKDSPTSSEF